MNVVCWKYGQDNFYKECVTLRRKSQNPNRKDIVLENLSGYFEPPDPRSLYVPTDTFVSVCTQGEHKYRTHYTLKNSAYTWYVTIEE
jgi:hypothetical protein